MFKKVKAGAAGLALVLAVCSAFTNARNVQRAETTYGVTAEGQDSLTVTDLTGLIEDEDYRCEQSTTICKVSADPEDVSNGKVARSDAEIAKQGNFQQ